MDQLMRITERGLSRLTETGDIVVERHVYLDCIRNEIFYGL